MVNAPPERIDRARVLLYAVIDESLWPTENCRHFVGGELMERAAGLAICQYEPGGGFYLFYCDGDWNVDTDTWHETLDAARAQAEFEYQGVSASWRKAGDKF